MENKSILIIGAIVIFGIIFIPTQLNDHPPTHCSTKPDNAGGYVPYCTDPTYVSIYTKYISKNY